MKKNKIIQITYFFKNILESSVQFDSLNFGFDTTVSFSETRIDRFISRIDDINDGFEKDTINRDENAQETSISSNSLSECASPLFPSPEKGQKNRKPSAAKPSDKTNRLRNKRAISKIGSSHEEGFTKPMAPIDTIKLAHLIKNMLADAKISQTVFAKEVAGIYQCDLSRYLSKPKPWAKCTEFQKRVFYKMHNWSQSPESVESLTTLSGSSRNGDNNQEINTFELADKVNNLLAKLGMTQAEFARMLNIHHRVEFQLLSRPEPWSTMSILKKEMCRKIHTWLIQNEKDGHQHSANEERVADVDIEEAGHAKMLNTALVAKQIVDLLKRYDIPHYYFAKKNLFIKAAYFDQLVFEPEPWERLHESQRNIFRCIEEWTRAGHSRLESLKREHSDFNKIRQYHLNKNKTISV
jgi:hypothetical protein